MSESNILFCNIEPKKKKEKSDRKTKYFFFMIATNFNEI